MLHKINLPACTHHLEWVLHFQGDLLHALCERNVVADDVTADWVRSCRPDIDGAWVGRFCDWSKDDQSVLARLKAAASLSPADKQALIAHYDSNLRYSEAFGDGAPPPPTQPLPGGLSKHAISVYRDFFQLFYAPIFYGDKGYPIVAADLNGEPFTKDVYLAAYHAANSTLNVCPLCDGSMDGAQFDHWLARKHLPELNCDPQNLVEICGACNSRTNKGEKLVLDANSSDPFGSWFHPHLRPAVGRFAVHAEQGAPALVSDDPVAQGRLNTLSALVNLPGRWKDEWRAQFKGIEQRIRHHRRRGRAFDEAALRQQLESWRTDAEGELGIRGHKLVERCLLSSTLVEGSDAFLELLSSATE